MSVNNSGWAYACAYLFSLIFLNIPLIFQFLLRTLPELQKARGCKKNTKYSEWNMQSAPSILQPILIPWSFNIRVNIWSQIADSVHSWAFILRPSAKQDHIFKEPWLWSWNRRTTVHVQNDNPRNKKLALKHWWSSHKGSITVKYRVRDYNRIRSSLFISFYNHMIFIHMCSHPASIALLQDALKKREDNIPSRKHTNS